MYTLRRRLKHKYWYPISVDIERALRKFRKLVDRTYLKIWLYILILFVISWGYCAFIKMRHDYSLINNYAHFEVLSSDYYTKWRTDGNPGQDPPK
jgi:hypothetical protein